MQLLPSFRNVGMWVFRECTLHCAFGNAAEWQGGNGGVYEIREKWESGNGLVPTKWEHRERGKAWVVGTCTFPLARP